MAAKPIYEKYHQNSNCKSRIFYVGELEETALGELPQRQTTGNGIMTALGANLAISGCPSLSKTLGDTIVMVENPEFAVGISTLFATIPEI